MMWESPGTIYRESLGSFRAAGYSLGKARTDAARKKMNDIQHPLAKSIRVKKQKNNDLLNGMQQN